MTSTADPQQQRLPAETLCLNVPPCETGSPDSPDTPPGHFDSSPAPTEKTPSKSPPPLQKATALPAAQPPRAKPRPRKLKKTPCETETQKTMGRNTAAQGTAAESPHRRTVPDSTRPPAPLDAAAKSVQNAPLTPAHLPTTGRTATTAAAAAAASGSRNPLFFRASSGALHAFGLPALLIGSLLLAYLIGRWGLSALLLLPIAHTVAFVHRRRTAAYLRANAVLARDHAARTRPAEYETVEWLNYIVRKFWEVAEAGVSAQIHGEVNRVLAANAPPFLRSLRLTELTLGTRPPIVERIAFFEKTDDAIVIEAVFNFIPVETPEDVLYYFGEERQHWNTRIELTATVGLIPLPILVRNFTFTGIARVTIDLSRRLPFVKRLGVSLMELPTIEFGLHPLRAGDFMDIPYLARLIKKITDTAITRLALFPRRFDVDVETLAQYRGRTVGVVYVYVYALESGETGEARVALSAEHSEFACTAVRTGADPLFREGGYAVVADTTRSVVVNATVERNRLTGRVFLRNLNKHAYTERVHVANETARAWVTVSTAFFPLTEARTGSAVVTATLVAVHGLQAAGCPKNRLYSTYAVLTLETHEAVAARRVLRTFETKRIFSTRDPFFNEGFRFFARNFADYVVRISIRDERTNEELGVAVMPLTCAEESGPTLYTLAGAAEGTVEVAFTLAYVDVSCGATAPLPGTAAKAVGSGEAVESTDNDWEETDVVVTPPSLRERAAEKLLAAERRAEREERRDLRKSKKTVKPIESEEHANTDVRGLTAEQPATEASTEPAEQVSTRPSPAIAVVGSFAHPAPEENDSVNPESENTGAAGSEEAVSLSLGIYTTTPPPTRPARLTRACRVSVERISEEGAFFLVFETPHLLVRSEPFSTELRIDRAVIFPLGRETAVCARLFRLLPGSDALVGETAYRVGDSALLFDHVRVDVTVEFAPLRPATADEPAERFRVVQCLLERPRGTQRAPVAPRAAFSAEFLAGGVLAAQGLLGRLYCLCGAARPLRAVVYEDGQRLTVLGLDAVDAQKELLLPRGMRAALRMRAQVCDFEQAVVGNRGTVEVFLIRASGVRPLRGGACEACVKVHVNGEKVFKTAGRPRSLDPVFNEKVRLRVDRAVDTLGLLLYDQSGLGGAALLAAREFPLYNLSAGFSRQEIALRPVGDAVAGQAPTLLQVILNFVPDEVPVEAVQGVEHY